MSDSKYVAFDVHTATIVVAVLDHGGKLVTRAVIKTEATAVGDFLRGLSGEVHLTFEEGTHAQWLFDLTRPLVADLIGGVLPRFLSVIVTCLVLRKGC
jgi:hypothetical protein